MLHHIVGAQGAAGRTRGCTAIAVSEAKAEGKWCRSLVDVIGAQRNGATWAMGPVTRNGAASRK